MRDRIIDGVAMEGLTESGAFEYRPVKVRQGVLGHKRPLVGTSM